MAEVAPHVSTLCLVPSAAPRAVAHRALLHSVSLIERQPTSKAALLELGATAHSPPWQGPGGEGRRPDYHGGRWEPMKTGAQDSGGP